MNSDLIIAYEIEYQMYHHMKYITNMVLQSFLYLRRINIDLFICLHNTRLKIYMLYMYSYLQSIKIFPSYILCISLYATKHFKTSKFNQMRYVHMGKIALHCTWKGLSCFKFNSDGEFYKLSFNILSWKIVNIK